MPGETYLNKIALSAGFAEYTRPIPQQLGLHSVQRHRPDFVEPYPLALTERLAGTLFLEWNRDLRLQC